MRGALSECMNVCQQGSSERTGLAMSGQIDDQLSKSIGEWVHMRMSIEMVGDCDGGWMNRLMGGWLDG